MNDTYGVAYGVKMKQTIWRPGLACVSACWLLLPTPLLSPVPYGRLCRGVAWAGHAGGSELFVVTAAYCPTDFSICSNSLKSRKAFVHVCILKFL